VTAPIELKGVSKRFGDVAALEAIDLAVNKGEVVVLIGPSGSGKSTLLRCVNALEAPDVGEVFLAGEAVRADAKGIDAQRAEVGMVFQHFNLFPHLTAIENVMLAPRHVRGRAPPQAKPPPHRLLDRVGVGDKRDTYPDMLSGGQKQRVAIARALAMEPIAMLFDEPTSALDPELVGSVLQVMREMRQSGMTMVVVSHEMRFARDAADRVVFMDDGRIVEEGVPERIFNDPQSTRLREFVAEVGR